MNVFRRHTPCAPSHKAFSYLLLQPGCGLSRNNLMCCISVILILIFLVIHDKNTWLSIFLGHLTVAFYSGGYL